MTEPAKPADRPKHVYTYRGEGASWHQFLWWGTGQLLSKVLGLVLFRLQARGLQHIPRSGGVLLVTNHQSFLDPWLIGIAPKRQVHYMARDTLFQGGVFTFLIETLNAFPVKRGTGDRQAIRTAAQRLDEGRMVNIFPEGTRSEDGTIGPVAPGVALILNLCKTPVPIVPTIIDGAFEAWPRHKKLPSPRKVRLAHGTPISAEEAKSLKPDELALRIRAALVDLQEQIGSPHAAASRERLQRDMEQTPARKRGTGGEPRMNTDERG